MLTILNDPAGITGRQRHEWDFSKTLQENIAAHIDGGGDCELSINGQRVDPLTDPLLDMPPSAFDLVTVARRPAGVETWFLVASLALSVYTYSQLPKIPNVETAKESPNNQLTGQTNLVRVYQAIPDVYGLRRVWPDLIQPSLIEYISNVKYITEWLCVSRGKGTRTEVNYADTAVASIPGTSVLWFEPESGPSAYPELNDTTLTNVTEAFTFPGVNGQDLPDSIPFSPLVGLEGYGFATGSPTTNFTITLLNGPPLNPLALATLPISVDVVLEGFVYDPDGYLPSGNLLTDTCSLTAVTVSGAYLILEFTAPTVGPDFTGVDYVQIDIDPSSVTPTVTIGPFTSPVTNLNQIRWNIVFLRGLKGTVNIEVKWTKLDSGGAPDPTKIETRTFAYTADTFRQQFFTRTVTPTYGNGAYIITFKRLTADIGNGADLAKLEAVYALRNYATKVLPGVTVAKVVRQADSGSSSAPDRRFNLRWNRHVRELTTDTISASRNFARSMAHVWSLAGEDITGLDTDALQTINTDFGETSDVLRFDGSFDDADVSLGERMQRIAWHARCSLWRDGTKWTVTRDQYQAYPAVQLDYRNLAAGGESSISYAAHLPATFDGVEIKYTDETTQAKAAYVRLKIVDGFVDVGLSRNPKKIDMPGCTTAAQALNRAHLEARRIMYQRTSVSETALADAGELGIDSMVRWVDPNDFAGDDGLQAGEVMAIDVPNLRITTSEPVDWKGETSGRILFTGTDGRQVGPTVVCTPFGALVQLAAMPAGLYVRDSARQLGSRYAFSVGLTAAETEAAGLYVVTEIRPAQDRTVFLALAAYDDRMYSED